MGEEGVQFVDFACAEVGNDRRNAEKKLFEVEEMSGSGDEGEDGGARG